MTESEASYKKCRILGCQETSYWISSTLLVFYHLAAYSSKISFGFKYEKIKIEGPGYKSQPTEKTTLILVGEGIEARVTVLYHIFYDMFFYSAIVLDDWMSLFSDIDIWFSTCLDCLIYKI